MAFDSGGLLEEPPRAPNAIARTIPSAKTVGLLQDVHRLVTPNSLPPLLKASSMKVLHYSLFSDSERQGLIKITHAVRWSQRIMPPSAPSARACCGAKAALERKVRMGPGLSNL